MCRFGLFAVVLLFLVLPARMVQAAGSVCPSDLDTVTCQLLQTALANVLKQHAFDVSYQLGVSKFVSSKATGLAGGGVGFFDLGVTGTQQRQGYLSMRFLTMGTDNPQDASLELHLIDDQWYIKTADKPNASRLKPAPTTPAQYQAFLIRALTSGVKAVQVGQFDHMIDKQPITTITITYDAPTLLQALFTGAGRDLVKSALGRELIPDLDAVLDQMSTALAATDRLQIMYLVGPDGYFHGLVVDAERSAIHLSLHFALEISQIGKPFKFNEPSSVP